MESREWFSDVVTNHYSLGCEVQVPKEFIQVSKGKYICPTPFKGKLDCALYRGFQLSSFKDETILSSFFLCHQQDTSLKSLASKLRQRDHSSSEIELFLSRMLKYVQLKPKGDWELTTLTKVDVQNEMTIVSEFDFKHRFLYADLEALYLRSFEQELLDNLDCLQSFFNLSAEPIVV